MGVHSSRAILFENDLLLGRLVGVEWVVYRKILPLKLDKAKEVKAGSAHITICIWKVEKQNFRN